MSMVIGAKWTGMTAIVAVYSTSKRIIQKERARRLKIAGRLVARVMKREIPRGPTGNLKNAVSWETNGRDQLEVGTDHRKKGPHGHLVNAGTTSRVRQSGGSTGKMRANKFIDRTADKTEAEVVNLIGDSLKVF